jgi:hypothetical protein
MRDTYTELIIDEWESCKKKEMDEYCEDCGAGTHCPLRKKNGQEEDDPDLTPIDECFMDTARVN